MSRVFVLLLALAALASDATLAATPVDGSTFPLTLAQGSRLMIAAKINGRPVTAVLDSAAEATVLDRELARELKLDHGQVVAGQGSGAASFDATLVEGVTLEALGLSLRDQTVAVADLSDVGRRLLGQRIDVILGREIFDAARLAIDIDDRRIAVVRRDREPRGVRLELVTEHGVETIPVRVESSEPVRATFDLGNGSRVLVGSALATRLRLLSDGREVAMHRGGGLGGEVPQQVITLRSLEVAGRRFANVPAAIDPNPSASDVNVGIALLRHFRITTDFANHVVWLEPRD
jgi:predicted aspartyl protease